MEATKKSEFDKVLSAWDILVIAFGAMIGWGWVVSTGDWIQKGGVAGAMLGSGVCHWRHYGVFCGSYICRTDIGNAAVRRRTCF